MRAFPVLPPVSRRAASTAAIDIRASVGTSTSPTSTGTKAVTGVGFQPKVVLPFSAAFESVGTATGVTLSLGSGISSSNRSAIAVASRNGATTSATHRRHTASGVVSLIDTSGSGAVFAASDFSSLDADGFTLDWSLVDTARILNHICLGGADLEVSLTQQQMNGTNAAQSFAHGLSGAPTGVLFFASVDAISPPNTATNLNFAIGAWAGASQFGALLESRNAVTTSLTRRLLLTNAVTGWVLGSTIQRTLGVLSVDASNVNVTYPVTNDTYQQRFFMLAIRGAKCQVGTFDCNGSTSPLTIATPGITPKLFLPVMVSAGVDSVGIVGAELLMSIGASDGTNNVSCGITDRNGVTTTDARRYQSSNSLVEHALNGSKVFEATAAFSGESVILTPTIVNSSAWGQGGWIVIGS